MSATIPRLRMFAGPNGSGKSTLNAVLPAELLGVYLNPDELERTIAKQGFLDLSSFRVTTTSATILSFFNQSEFLKHAGFAEASARLTFDNDRLNFSQVTVNSYFASVAADFLRQRLLESEVSFTFETVMSHRSKVEILAQARQRGYRTYLYYVATDDPVINISRVRNRVRLGGHSVPEELIESRYYRSLDLLLDAIRQTDRAYVFDNSGDSRNHSHTWLAEVTDGTLLQLKSDLIPAWFQRAILDKVTPE